MPYFNVSYTDSNPYDNNPGWTDGSTMSGIFFLNGISLGIDRVTTQYDNKFLAPGGQYVTWSAPFNLSSNRYALYTNSYLQGISGQKRDDETGLYVVPFPICFQSDELTGATSSDIQALKSLFIKQQGIASPLDYGTVFPIVSNPEESFVNILKCYSDSSVNSYANEYLITSTYGDYEYLAIWKNKLSTVLDFGWEASVSRAFHNNPQDGKLFNIASVGKIDLQISDTSQALFFSNEKYGYIQFSSDGDGLAYLRNESAITDDINNKYKMSVAFWIDSTFSQPKDPQMIFNMVSSYDSFGNKLYRPSISVQLNNDDTIGISFEAQYNRGLDSTITSKTNVSIEPTFIQICIDTNRNDQAYNLIVYLNGEEFHTFDFTNNGGYDFQGIDHYFFLGVPGSQNNDPPQPENTKQALGIRLHSFYFWPDEVIVAELTSQNYWLTKQRYS